MKTRAKVALGGLLALAMMVPTSGASQSKDFLSKGKISVRTVAVKGSDAPRAIVTGVVNAPPEKVWKVLENCNNYKKTFGRLISSKLLKQSGDQYICKVVVDMPFPLGDLSGVTRATHKVEPGKEWSRKWTLIRGDYTRNDGSWVVRPFGDAGTRSWVQYQVHAEPNIPIPGWIRNEAQKSTLPDMSKKLRKAVRNVR